MGNENLADYLKKVISERIKTLRIFKHEMEKELNCDNEYRVETPISCFQIYLAHCKMEGKLAGWEKVLQDIQNWEEKGDGK
jgi:hypothetical protein